MNTIACWVIHVYGIPLYVTQMYWMSWRRSLIYCSSHNYKLTGVSRITLVIIAPTCIRLNGFWCSPW